MTSVGKLHHCTSKFSLDTPRWIAAYTAPRSIGCHWSFGLHPSGAAANGCAGRCTCGAMGQLDADPVCEEYHPTPPASEWGQKGCAGDKAQGLQFEIYHRQSELSLPMIAVVSCKRSS